MKKSLIIFSVSIFSIFASLSILTSTDAYYPIYLLLGIIGVICSYINLKKQPKLSYLEYCFSSLFAIFITLANYPILTANHHTIISIISIFIVLIGSFNIFINILPFIATITIKTNLKSHKPKHPFKTFLFYFSIFFLIDSIIFLLCYYPGNLTSDSIDEVGQLLTNSYSNHHPFYFTLLIKFFVSAGIDLFNNINIGIAMFNIFQIFVISSAFSYAITTLRQIGISKKSALVLAIVLAIMPYNIIYSFTVWKDIIFGASFLIFIVAIYRYLNQLTKHEKMLLSTIAISGITICLFRSNALIAFFATTIIFLIIFKKRYLKLGILLCGIVCLSFILKNPVLKASNIPQPDIVESLAIPMQQITRVLTEKNLPEDDIALISNVANPNQLRASYVPYIHDPLKYIVRMNGNKNYISEHKIDFLALYLKLGIKYPWQYTKAWIDQTKGYWNAGYRYWRWADEIAANDYGIDRSTVSSKIKNLFSTYLQIFDKFDFLSPLISIGFAAWILIVIFFLSLKKKDRTAMILAIFLLTTWGTLLIATPVFSEFRYVYFLFTCIPFLSITTLIKSRRKALHEKK